MWAIMPRQREPDVGAHAVLVVVAAVEVLVAA